MAEALLITNADVQMYRRIDPNIEAGRFNSFSLEIHRVNLRDLLGSALYYDFFLGHPNASGTPYNKLLNGDTYTTGGETCQYYGLKPVLSYWWLSKYTNEGDLFTSNYGAVDFVNNSQQMYQAAKDRDRLVSEYTQTAAIYANEVVRFLNNNASLFPLWDNGNEINPTDFIMFKV